MSNDDFSNGTGDEEDFVPVVESVIQERIIHVLTIYPRISPSMLQVGIGTAISPKLWHPIFNRLKAEGRIVESEYVARGPTGRDQTYKIVSLVTQST